jgi:Putative adhesin
MRRRTFGTVTLGWLLAAAVAASAGCEIQAGEGGLSLSRWTGQANDTWTRTYTIEAGGRLEILNINGQIRAEATTGAAVEVTAERSAAASSDEAAKELLGKIEMREEVSPARVRIETRAPRVTLGGHKASFLVRVPAGVHVDLRTVNGGVRLDNVGGEVRATSTNGGVQGRVAAASIVEARTTNGGVEVELTGPLAADGRLQLTSVNGGVRLRLPADTRADITARCTNGRVSVSDFELDVEGEQSRRRVEGRLNGGGARIDLQTTNGGVSIGRS